GALRISLGSNLGSCRARRHLRCSMEASVNRYLPGNRITLLRSGGEYFPALVLAIDGAEREVWLETYIYADDDVGRIVTAALIRAAQRGIVVRVLVDGWGAKHYLTAAIERELENGKVSLLKY